MDEKIELARKKLQRQIDSMIWSIRCDLDTLEEELNDYTNLEEENKTRYVDIYKLISEMKKDDVYSKEIEDFFDNYIKFKMK